MLAIYVKPKVITKTVREERYHTPFIMCILFTVQCKLQ